MELPESTLSSASLDGSPAPAAAASSRLNIEPAPPASASPQPTSRRNGMSLPSLLFAALVAGALSAGWLQRQQAYLAADEGLGYALGITGGVMMLLLLSYPLRKHLPLMRNWGAMRHWFRMHMLLGILGPVCILFHCNFQLGSVNSNVALTCMLIVAGSGLIGRYAYTRIHFGLYGQRATLAELQRRRGIREGEMHQAFSFAPDVEASLKHFEATALRPASGWLSGFWKLLTLGLAARRTRRRCVRELRTTLQQQARQDGWAPRMLRARRRNFTDIIHNYIATVRQVAELAAYERIFSLWHVLHIPLFIMLVMAGIAHVIAVHMY